MTQTIKERLESYKVAHEGDTGQAPIYRKGFNAGVDACLPLLEEEYRQGLICVNSNKTT